MPRGITERNYKQTFPMSKLHNTRRDFLGDEVKAPEKAEPYDNIKYPQGSFVRFENQRWEVKTSGRETLFLENINGTAVVVINRDKFQKCK